MRLLDLISQGRAARVRTDDGCELPAADRFSEAIRNCPLRYVLSDELVRCATQLAYAEGDRLSACLDLIHVPAQSLWIEWPDGPRREALEEIPALDVKNTAPSRHGGALVTALPNNFRSGHIRTFWSTLNEQAHLSPVVITFDLDRPPPPLTPKDPFVWRGETVLTMDGEPAIEEMLDHLRFHFDDHWAEYYHTRCPTEVLRAAVLRGSLGGCAFDAPMLMAFFLLLGARDLLPRQEVCHERLNHARRRDGKPPLLEHIEVSAPLDKAPARRWAQPSEALRLSPRLHHVRGHLVRRGSAVFWRSPHLRGNGRFGQVRSRTVVLTFGPASESRPETTTKGGEYLHPVSSNETSTTDVFARKVSPISRLTRSATMASTETLEDIYTSELRDLWSANEQMTKVVKIMSEKAHDPKLKQTLQKSVTGIQQHTQTLKSLLTDSDASIKKNFCPGMEGLVKEATKHITQEAPGNSDLLDIEIIAQYQRMSHYGLAGFGTAAAYAKALRKEDHLAKLGQIVADIYKGDEYASTLAERVEAAAA